MWWDGHLTKQCQAFRSRGNPHGHYYAREPYFRQPSGEHSRVARRFRARFGFASQDLEGESD